MKKLYITEEQVLETLTMVKAVELVEGAFRGLADGSAINHPRQRVILPTGSVLHYMAAGMPHYFGIKVYSTNPKSGAHFEVLLYRSEDGMPLATLEANHLGQIRTGAASGVATKFLAREDAKIAAVIGSGVSSPHSAGGRGVSTPTDRGSCLEPQCGEARSFRKALRGEVRFEHSGHDNRPGVCGRRGHRHHRDQFTAARS